LCDSATLICMVYSTKASTLSWFVAVVLAGTAVGLADCVYRPLSRLSRLRDQVGSPARQAHCPATLLDDQPCGPWRQDYAALHAEIIAGKSCKCVATSQAHIRSCSKSVVTDICPTSSKTPDHAHVKQRLHRPFSGTQIRTGKCPLALAMAFHCPSRLKQVRVWLQKSASRIARCLVLLAMACAYSDEASLELVQLLGTDAKYTITVMCVGADSTQEFLLCLQEVGLQDT